VVDGELIEKGAPGEVQGVYYSSELVWGGGRYGIKGKGIPLGHCSGEKGERVVINCCLDADVALFMHASGKSYGRLEVFCGRYGNEMVGHFI
jgi:hypothetical protein